MTKRKAFECWVKVLVDCTHGGIAIAWKDNGEWQQKTGDGKSACRSNR
jgi:hypothetical protein